MIEECNFKYAATPPGCHLRERCSGEENCVLFQIYRLLNTNEPRLIIDWDKLNVPEYKCISCGRFSYNFFEVFDQKTGKCKSCGFKVKK